MRAKRGALQVGGKEAQLRSCWDWCDLSCGRGRGGASVWFRSYRDVEIDHARFVQDAVYDIGKQMTAMGRRRKVLEGGV